MTGISSARPDDLDAWANATKGLDEVLRERHARLVRLYGEFVAGTSWGTLDASSLLNGFAQWLHLNQIDGRWVATIADAFRSAGGGSVGAELSDAAIQDALERNGVSGSRGSVTFDDPIAWGAQPTSGYADDPVNTGSGNFVLAEDDIRSPGLAGLLRWSRTYNSRSSHIGPLGRGWSCLASARLVEVGGAAHWVAPDGQRAVLAARAMPSPSAFEQDPGVHGEVIREADGLALVTPDGAAWRFGHHGLLRSIDHGPGTRVTASYDDLSGSPQLTSLSHEGGRRLDLTWNGQRIVSVKGPGDEVVEYRYDGSGDLVGIERPAGPLNMEVDAGGRLVSITDGDGVVSFVNLYGDDGRVISQLSPFGRRTSYSYIPGGKTIVADDSAGPVMTSLHDERGRLITLVDDNGARLTKAYDEHGDVVAVTDRLGATTLFQWDEHRRMAARVLPTGAVIRFEHDELGRVSKLTGPDLFTVLFRYEGSERIPSEVVDACGAVTRMEVNNGLVHRLVDPDEVAFTFAYDGNGALTSIADGDGHRTSLERDAAGRVVAAQTALGFRTQLELDKHSRPQATIDPLGTRTQRVFSSAGRLLEVVDALGARTALRRGPAGEVQEAIDPLGGVTTRGFDMLGNLARVTQPGGANWELQYDGLGRCVSVVDPTEAVWKRSYDAEGHVVETTDPEGLKRRAEVDICGRLIALADGPSPSAREASVRPATVRFVYDSLGRVVRQERADGTIFGAAYDGCGHCTTVVDADGGVTRLEYTPGGRLASLTTPLGHITSYRYDRCGRLVALIDPTGARTTFRYDQDGRLTDLKDATGTIEKRRYDGCGRLVEQELRGRRYTTTYDPVGRPVALTDPAGAVQRFTFDSVGRLIEAFDANGSSSRYEYGASGNLSAIVDPLGGRIERRHDATGRVVSEVDQLGRTTIWKWGAAGRLQNRRLPDGSVRRFWYDERGHIGAVGGAEPLIFYSRDEFGRPITIREAGRTTDLAYDHAGRLTTKRQTTSGVSLTLERRYDADGRLAALIGPDATETTLRWSGAGRLLGFTHPGSGAVAFHRDASGHLVAATAPGRRHSWLYVHGELVRADVSIDGEAPRSTTFRRDSTGRVVEADGPNGIANYSYDVAGQLLEVNSSWGSWRFRYDVAGRLVGEESPAGPRTYVHDSAHQLVEMHSRDGVWRFQYDGAGRRTTEQGPTTTRRFVWDSLGRLEVIERQTGDAPADRTTLEVDHAGDLVLIDETPLLWDTGGALSRLVLFGATSLIGFEPLRGSVESPNTLSWFGDEHSETKLLDPFGAPNAPRERGMLERRPLGYRGELTVDGLLWLRQRIYDPTTRGFLSADPLGGEPGSAFSATPYHYSGNDPVGHLDPSGLHPLTDAEFESLREALSQNGFERAGHWTQDNWEYIAAGAMIVGGVLVMATGVGGPIGAAMIGGALLSGGISAGAQKYTTGGVSWDRVGVDMLVGAAAGGAGGWVGTSRVLTTISNPVLRGAAVGASESLVGGRLSRAAYGADPFDVTGMGQDFLLGGGLGAAGARLSAGKAVGAEDVRFSQRSVNGSDDLRAQIERFGWAGQPLDVVTMPDGSYTSVDNTRLAVAREMNIGVRVRVHGYDDPLPQGFSNPLDPRFPSPKTGEPASTWGEAVENRIGSQGSAFRGENPLGAQEIPRMR